jgi:hypothetical protein
MLPLTDPVAGRLLCALYVHEPASVAGLASTLEHSLEITFGC